MKTLTSIQLDDLQICPPCGVIFFPGDQTGSHLLVTTLDNRIAIDSRCSQACLDKRPWGG